jgi:hypothetical protein
VLAGRALATALAAAFVAGCASVATAAFFPSCSR